MAKAINPLLANEDNSADFFLNSKYNYNQDMKVPYLSKLLAQQQQSCDHKITFLETELKKTQDRLIEKSLALEKNDEVLVSSYKTSAIALKRELVLKTKSLFESQRQIEKMNPSEDLKNMIKLNTKLASELRKSEDQLAILQSGHFKGRLPASESKEK
jgi:hypothetical protein